MEFSPFKLIVYGIVALALILIIVNFFLVNPDPIKELKEGISLSENDLGKFNSKKIFFPEAVSFSSKTFNSSNRFVSFQCNYTQKCDPEKINVDLNSVKLLLKQEQTVSFRCIQDYPLNECRIYFGIEPAQIILNELNSNESFNLDSEKALISFSYFNAGSIDANNCISEIEIKREEKENGNSVKSLYDSFEENLGDLFAGESNEKIIELNLRDSGKYFVTVKVSCPDAGNDKKTVSFNVSKTVTSSNCSAELGKPFSLDSINYIDCLCEKCNYAFECRNKCNEEFNEFEFELISSEKATAKYNKEIPECECSQETQEIDCAENEECDGCNCVEKTEKLCGNGEINDGEECGETGLNCEIGFICSNCKCIKEIPDTGEWFSGTPENKKGYNQVIFNKIVEIATREGVPSILVLSVARQESNFTQCCKESGKNHSTDCKPDLVSVSCDLDKLLLSYNNSSYGVMQINKGVHPDCFETKPNASRTRTIVNSKGEIGDNLCYGLLECDNKSVLDFECNIAAGIEHLKRYHSSIPQKYDCTNLEGKHYYEYFEIWDIALRRYNGLYCPDNGARSYVEDVKSRASDFK
ncbi:MAG: hypothetical protein JW703_02715 [Candidatus Diapherotrites archaeon]|nr:hypothetical protein [Candidatus Diapherotrites archaeon]